MTRNPEGTGAGTVMDRVRAHVAAAEGDVFLRLDFAHLGGSTAVGHALARTVAEGGLIRFGHGVYCRAAPSVFDGRPALVKGIRAVTEEALARLGVLTHPSAMTMAHDAGRTTQVPSGRVVGTDRPVTRVMGVDGVRMRFETVRPRRGQAGRDSQGRSDE